jgi:hypothetical protein
MPIKPDEPTEYLSQVNGRIASWNSRKPAPHKGVPLAPPTVLVVTAEPTATPKPVPVEQSPTVLVGVPPTPNDGLRRDKTAQAQKPDELLPLPPPIFQQVPLLPPAAAVPNTSAGTGISVTPPLNPFDTDSITPHASPPATALVNSTAPEPTPAPRLSVSATVAADAMPPEVITPVVGGEQGVTTASLELTLPDAPCGRTGKKGTWKTTPYKPRKKMKPEELRTHCVSVRFSAAELARLTTDMHAQHKKELGAVVRDAYLNGPRPLVPAVNVEKWGELARPLANLNQIALHLNAGHLPEDYRPLLDKLARQFHIFRAELLGQNGVK